MADETDCDDEDKSMFERLKDCMGGEESGVEKRE